MSEQHADSPATPHTKAELTARIDQSWSALTAAIDRVDEARLTTAGPDGWSIKDQMAHVSAWERSLIALLTGRSRADAIGVDDATYQTSDVDALNEIIHDRAKDRPLAAVRTDFRRTHDDLLAALRPLTDADLSRPYSDFQPNDPPDNRNPVITWIADGSFEHYDEHRATIEETAGTSA